MGTAISKRDVIWKNNWLTSKIVTVIAVSDEINPKNQMNKTTMMFLQILTFLVWKRTSALSLWICIVMLLLHLIVLDQLIWTGSEIIPACSKQDHVLCYDASKYNWSLLMCTSWGLGLAPTEDFDAWGKTWTEVRILNPKLQSQTPTDSCCPCLEASKLTSYLLV